jgi:hypothetical protein
VIDRHRQREDPVDEHGGFLSTIVARDLASGLVRAEDEVLLHSSGCATHADFRGLIDVVLIDVVLAAVTTRPGPR